MQESPRRSRELSSLGQPQRLRVARRPRRRGRRRACGSGRACAACSRGPTARRVRGTRPARCSRRPRIVCDVTLVLGQLGAEHPRRPRATHGSCVVQRLCPCSRRRQLGVLGEERDRGTQQRRTAERRRSSTPSSSLASAFSSRMAPRSPRLGRRSRRVFMASAAPWRSVRRSASASPATASASAIQVATSACSPSIIAVPAEVDGHPRAPSASPGRTRKRMAARMLSRSSRAARTRALLGGRQVRLGLGDQRGEVVGVPAARTRPSSPRSASRSAPYSRIVSSIR